MGLRPGSQSPDCLIKSQIGSAYDNIRTVVANIEEIGNVAEAITDRISVTKAVLITQGLSGDYGFFADGFDYVNVGDVGIDTNGNMYTYNGTLTLPVNVPDGTDPVGDSDYQVINLDHVYARVYNSVDEMVSSSPQEGDVVVTKGYQNNQDGGRATFIIRVNIDESNSIWYKLSNGLYAVLIDADSSSLTSGYTHPSRSANYLYSALEEEAPSEISGIPVKELRDPAGAYTYFQKEGVKLKSELNFDASNTGEQIIGELVIPANIAQNMKKFNVLLEQTGLPIGTTVDIGLSATRRQPRHRFKKTLATSEDLEFKFKKSGATVVTAVDPSYFTELPITTAGLVNGLGIVRVPVYLTLPEPAPSAQITTLSLSIPRVSTVRQGTEDLSCKVRPFGLESAWNTEAQWKTRPPVFTHDKTSAGGNHASGVAGQNVITVADTSGVRIGDLVTVSKSFIKPYAPYNNYRNFIVYKYDAETLTTIGAGVTVVSIDSPTQITISKPLVSSFSYVGSDGFFEAKVIATVTARNLSAVSRGTNIWATSPVTGKPGEATINPYSGYVASFKLQDSKEDTRPFTIHYEKWVGTNGFLNEIIGTDNFGEEVLNGQFTIDVPVDMDITYTVQGDNRNADNNVIIESPCGRFSIELFYCYNPQYSSINCNRVSVVDKTFDDSSSLFESKVKHSLATRAYGGSLVAGLVTKEDLVTVPKPSKSTSEEELLNMMQKAEGAINHAIAVVPPVATLKSNSNSDGNFYSVTRTVNDPIFTTSGTGYSVGDLIFTNPISAPSVEAACCMVVEVDTSGAVIKAEWTIGGQLLQTITSPLDTTTDGGGSGAILDISNFSESVGEDNQGVYPASVIDTGFNNYNGSLQMGDRLTINPDIDLRSEWLEIIKNTAANRFDNNLLHMYAVMWAIKRYGAIVCDVTNYTFLAVNSSHYDYTTTIAQEIGGYDYPGAIRLMELLVPCDNSGYYTENMSNIDVSKLV